MNSYYLSDLLEIKNGKDHKGIDDGNIPVYGSGGLMRFVNKFLYDNESILLPRKGTLSNIQFVKEPFWTVDTLYYTIVNKEKAIPYYLYYCLKQLDLSKLNSGTGVPSMTFGAYYGIKLKLPSIKQQQKIASMLSSLDDKIELNNKINTELEQIAKTLYDYWFVQFDFPNEEGKPYKSSGGKMVYNEILKREIPEGWEVKNLGDTILKVESGKRPKGGINKNLKIGIPSLGAESIDKLGCFSFSNTKYIPFEYRDKITTGIIQNNDILVYKDGAYVGKTTLFRDNFPFEFATINEHVFLIRSLNHFFQEYLLFTLMQKPYFEIMQSLGQKAAQPGLNQEDLKGIKLIVPTDIVIKNYSEKIDVLLKRLFLNSKQNQELAVLRDWLLPMLMNGQVTVGDVVDQKASTVKGDGRIRDLFGDEEYLRRKALAVYIVNQSIGDMSFGKTKFMKLLHLVEYHIVKGSLEQAYYQHAAGPYDGAFAKKFWNEVIEDKWYRIEKLGTLDHIIPGTNYKETQDYISSITDDLKQQIKAFIHIFKDCNYEQPEVVSTLYAVWNNRIIQKEMITDALLKQDFLAWDEQKEKYEDKLDKALVWMRSNKIVPTGWGKVIKASKSRRG